MGADDLRFSEQQHFALLSEAVTRETAALQTRVDEATAETARVTEERDTLATRIDVLEAEKASEFQAREAIAAEFESFRADLVRAEEIRKLCSERTDRVKAAAPQMAEDYLADEARQRRWAEMAEETFTAFLEDLAQTAKSPQLAVTDEALRQTAAFSPPPAEPQGSALSSLFTAAGKLPANGTR